MKTRLGFLFCFLLFVLWVGPRCVPMKEEACPPGNSDCDDEVPATDEDGGEGEASENQAGDRAEAEVDRDLDCNELIDSDIEAGGNCDLMPVLGGPVRTFTGKIRRSCSDVSENRQLDLTLNLEGCRLDPGHDGENPPFLRFYQCPGALDISVERTFVSEPYRLSSDNAECRVQPTRLECVSMDPTDPVCGHEVAFFFVFIGSTEDIFDPEHLLINLPQQIPDPGIFSIVSVVAANPAQEWILEGTVEPLDGESSAGDYQCSSGRVAVSCEPMQAAPAGEGGGEGTRLTVEIKEPVPVGTMVSAFSRFSLEPGPVNLKVTQNLVPRTSPAGVVQGASVPETLNLLLLPRAAILPHVPFGRTGSLRIRTQIIVNNPHGETVEGKFQFFNTVDGEPLDVTLDEVTASEHDFTIGPTESRLFEIDATGVDPPQTAWAFVQGERELTAATNFSTLDSSQEAAGVLQPQTASAADILAEAGIAASGVGLRHVLSVSSDGVLLATAFAIVNPTKGTASLSLRLKTAGESGELQTVAEADFILEPHRQIARFFDEFFDLEPAPFQGTLEINSDTSLSVMSIRTLGGLQSASLPSGTP